MTEPGKPQAEILEAVLAYVKQHNRDDLVLDDLVVERLAGSLEDIEVVADSPAGPPPHQSDLARDVSELQTADDRYLAAIGNAIAEADPALAWQADDGSYYRSDAAVGDSYRLGNMNTTLAVGDNVIAGLFLLRPGVDYLDHRHAAPEFYLNLTGPSSWRLDFGAWHELAAGSMLWNEPGRVHAVRTGTTPWLSFWAWLSDIDQPCEVVEDGQSA